MILTPSKGHLLIAEPSLTGDVSFNRSVILLASHNDEGSVGFILNKPLQSTLSDLIDDLDMYDIPVYNGGPVEKDNLYFIHTVPHLIKNSQEISSGIFWGGNFEKAIDLLINNKIDNNSIKFFLGYSGWGSFQLEKELDEKTWVIQENEVQDELLTKNHRAFWRDKIMELGGTYLIWSNTPENPQCN